MQVCSMLMIMMFILDHLELTTCHKPTTEDQQQQDQKAVNKPPAILDYNKNMGAMDHHDQQLQPYDSGKLFAQDDSVLHVADRDLSPPSSVFSWFRGPRFLPDRGNN
ncbi:uncharacterized protein LOC143281386 [Babylonia areolata]|uniref:uncharacterized protein LOC143281386 n=1 Tax=Babylonia areolata TaxID=304850 RepID=UPI003FCF9FFE